MRKIFYVATTVLSCLIYGLCATDFSKVKASEGKKETMNSSEAFVYDAAAVPVQSFEIVEPSTSTDAQELINEQNNYLATLDQYMKNNWGLGLHINNPIVQTYLTEVNNIQQRIEHYTEIYNTKLAEEEAIRKAEEEKELAALAQTTGTGAQTTTPSNTGSLPSLYSAGVINWGGYRWTWYSQRVLPGTGLAIPGRHVDESGYVCDADNYICLASSDLAKGTVVPTPFGKSGKIYDAGCASGTLDVYVNW